MQNANVSHGNTKDGAILGSLSFRSIEGKKKEKKKQKKKKG
jgi:hypothetical protein